MAGMNFSAFEALDVGATAVSLTAATYGAADAAFLYLDDGTVRVRLDGTAPTAANGMQWNAGEVWEFENAREIADAQFISTDGSTYTLMINYGVRQ